MATEHVQPLIADSTGAYGVGRRESDISRQELATEFSAATPGKQKDRGRVDIGLREPGLGTSHDPYSSQGGVASWLVASDGDL